MSCIQHHGVQTIRPDTLKKKKHPDNTQNRGLFLQRALPAASASQMLWSYMPGCFFFGGGPHVALGSCAEDDLDLLRPLLPSAPISALGLQVCTIKPSLFNTEDQTEGIGRQSRKASTPPTEPHLQTCFSSSQSTSCS